MTKQTMYSKISKTILKCPLCYLLYISL